MALRRLSCALIVLASLGVTRELQAQESVAFNAQLGLRPALGGWSERSGVGLAGMLGVQVHVLEEMKLSYRMGFVHGLYDPLRVPEQSQRLFATDNRAQGPRREQRLTRELPALLGAHYALDRRGQARTLWLGAEAGVIWLQQLARPYGSESLSEAQSFWTLALSGGLRYELGRFEIGASLLWMPLEQPGASDESFVAALLTLGFDWLRF